MNVTHQMRSALVLFFGLLLLSVGQGKTIYQNCEIVDSSENIYIQWNYDSVAEGISYSLFQNKAPEPSWFAFGAGINNPGTAGELIDTDLALMAWNGEEFTFVDAYVNSDFEACNVASQTGLCEDSVYDGIEDLEDTLSTVDEEYVQLEWFKKLDTTDDDADNVITPDGPTPSVFAYGPVDDGDDFLRGGATLTGSVAITYDREAEWNCPTDFFCGNGIIDSGEQCDGGFACNAECVCATGWESESPVGLACVRTADAPPTTSLRGMYDLGYANFVYDRTCGLELYWTPYNSDVDTEIKMAVVGPSAGWIGVGFHEERQMIGSKSVIALIDEDDDAHVNFFDINSKESITIDKTIDAKGVIIQEDDLMAVFFSVPLENDFVDFSSRNYVLFAYRDEDKQFVEHNCKSSVEYQFVASDNVGPMANRNAHGILMMIGLGYFIIFGILSATGRFLCGTKWVYVHGFFQVFGFVIGTAGIIVAFDMQSGDHFQTNWHSQIGLTTWILCFLQLIGGLVRPNTEEDEDKTMARKVFEIIHPLFGYITAIMIIITVFSGIQEIGWHWWVYIFYGLCVSDMLALVLTAKLFYFVFQP